MTKIHRTYEDRKRKFGGKVYTMDALFHKKTEAKRGAKRARDRGFSTRIIKTADGYAIYCRATD